MKVKIDAFSVAYPLSAHPLSKNKNGSKSITATGLHEEQACDEVVIGGKQQQQRCVVHLHLQWFKQHWRASPTFMCHLDGIMMQVLQ